ncbi:MAG: DUF559 domain-containing protein [Myxococcaceae bacterium]
MSVPASTRHRGGNTMVIGDLKCLEAASAAFGVLHRKTALSHLTRTQLERRISRAPGKPMVRVFRSVYRVAGAPQTWRQRLEALMQWAGPTAVLSHRTAAALHGFDDFRIEDTATATEGPLEVTVRTQRRKQAGTRIYRVKPPPKRDVIERDDGLRVTTVPRTLLDLSAQLKRWQIRSLASEALRRKLTTLDELRRLVRRTHKRPGICIFRSVVEELSGQVGPTESELEELALRVLERNDMPMPRVQKPVASGGRKRRVDLLFKDEKVIVEADGYAFHSGVEAFEDDRARRNALVRQGYTVLQWTWRALRDTPEELIAQLRALLKR